MSETHDARRAASKGCIEEGTRQTYFTDKHTHKDGTVGHDLRFIDPATGKDAGMFRDKIERG